MSDDELLGYPIFLASVADAGREVSFALDDPIDEIQRYILKGEFYERGQLDYHSSLIPRGGRVLDVGANIGNHSVYYALVCEAELVVSIEPARRASRLFKRTLEQNALTGIELHAATAAGAGSGWAMLDQTQAIHHNLGGTSIEIVAKRVPGAVRVCTADELLDGRAVDFVKIDVEGAEMDVLIGLQQTFDLYRPIVAVEIMPASRRSFATWCADNGYRIERTFQMYRNVLNYVCVPHW
jgi:FkbM family methyltransferase